MAHRTGMQHLFSQVPQISVPRSSFDRSHGYKTTLDAGWLVPVFLDEALPGDTFSLNMTTFARLSTPLHPFMDNLYMDAFFFAVPLRLIWDNFTKMFGEQVNPGDSTSYLVPTMTSPAGGYLTGSLQDYMGLPVAGSAPAGGVPAGNTFTHAAFFTRAYNLIYNEWFRDQNLQNSVTVNKGDGPDNPVNYVLLRRGKRHDYFTSALPWPQKGPSVAIPIGNIPIVTSANQLVTGGPKQPVTFRHITDGTTPANNSLAIGAGGQGGITSTAATIAQGLYPSNLMTDLNSTANSTINQLRQAFQIQRIYERDARGGTRYTELIQAHFGVVSPDARLQRPEYLGGGTTPINVNPIAQTGPSGTTGSTTPQGNLTGVGTSSMRGAGFSKSFTEHSVIIGLVSVRADMNYQQGMHKMWTRSSRFDFFWPALAQIGEQAILNKEIFVQGVPATDDAVFGYQERYAEYRYKPSMITGQFRSQFATTLDSWHLAQTFSALPTLSSTFIVENPPVARVVAVPSQPHFLFDAHFQLKCARPMPVYGIPGNVDRM